MKDILSNWNKKSDLQFYFALATINHYANSNRTSNPLTPVVTTEINFDGKRTMNKEQL